MNCDQVLAELSSSAGGQFDPTLVPLFLELDFTAYQRMVDGHQVAASQGMETPSLPEEPMA
jgi:HD-GYP domain-containing protein (c-di-GMP phosphodiesterase class II)